MSNNNFFYLFSALLIYLIGTPIALDLEWVSEETAWLLGSVAVLAISIWTFNRSRRVFSIKVFLAVAGIVVTIANAFIESDALLRISLLVLLAFLILAIVESLRSVAFTTEISSNRLVGGVCVYLLLGLAWAIAYQLLYHVQPGSFDIPNAGQEAPSLTYWNYYSFVTLTTLGYGDILPVSAAARTLAYAEAVLGQLYVAILVAGLVGAYVADRQEIVNKG